MSRVAKTRKRKIPKEYVNITIFVWNMFKPLSFLFFSALSVDMRVHVCGRKDAHIYKDFTNPIFAFYANMDAMFVNYLLA